VEFHFYSSLCKSRLTRHRSQRWLALGAL
jgi:hypothetical protein